MPAPGFSFTPFTFRQVETMSKPNIYSIFPSSVRVEDKRFVIEDCLSPSNTTNFVKNRGPSQFTQSLNESLNISLSQLLIQESIIFSPENFT